MSQQSLDKILDLRVTGTWICKNRVVVWVMLMFSNSNKLLGQYTTSQVTRFSRGFSFPQ